MPAYFGKVWNTLDAIIVLALSPYFLIKLKTLMPAEEGILVHPGRLLRMKPNMNSQEQLADPVEPVDAGAGAASPSSSAARIRCPG